MSENKKNQAPQILVDDEIDLISVFQILWKGKWHVIGITIIFAVVSIIYSLSLPNLYKAEALLSPADGQAQAGGGQLQGLATMAGLNLGNGTVDKVDVAVETMKSHKFISDFIKRRGISAPLMAIKGWNQNANEAIYDSEIYNTETKAWLGETKLPPTDFEVYEKFLGIFKVNKNTTTKLIEVSIVFPVPEMAKKWVQWMIDDINQYSRSKAIKNSQKSAEYLRNQLSKTNVEDIRKIFFSLIKQETQNMLLAETREEYILEVIDPAYIPEKKNSPRRSLIVIVATLLGGIFSLLFVLGRHLIFVAKNQY